jgi:hypothetical protein
MTQEQLRMQMLAGIITEGQYKTQLKEGNLYYQFSEYDFDITQEPGYQEDVITRVKSSLPDTDDEKIMGMIRSLEDYHYAESRAENKRGREYPKISSKEFASEVIDNLTY